MVSPGVSRVDHGPAGCRTRRGRVCPPASPNLRIAARVSDRDGTGWRCTGRIAARSDQPRAPRPGHSFEKISKDEKKRSTSSGAGSDFFIIAITWYSRPPTPAR